MATHLPTEAVLITACPHTQGTTASPLGLSPSLPLALARILTPALANTAPLAQSERGLIENLVNYLASRQRRDDTA